LTLTRPDGSRVKGDAAVQEVASLIRVNYRDFFCTAYQHQETLRGVLTQEPRDRNDAIDRLLGLSVYRNVAEALRQARVVDVQKQMLNRVEVLQAKVQTALSTRRKDLDEKKAEATQDGLTDADFTEGQAIARASALGTDVGLVANEMNLPEPAFEEPTMWCKVKPFCAEVEAFLASLLRQAPETKAQQELLAGRDRVVRAKVAAEGALQAMEAIVRNQQEFVESSGTAEVIEKKIAVEKDGLSSLDTEIRSTTPN
jgi:DNA repair protein SbcC/Rad50